MKCYLQTKLRILLLLVAIIFFEPAHASHIIGGSFTYQFLDSITGNYHYKVTLTQYRDCDSGLTPAIIEDDPAIFVVYEGMSPTPFNIDTAVFSVSSEFVPVFSTGICGLGVTPLCVSKITFEKEYYLPPSRTTGYTIAQQRCCRNRALTSLIAPEDNGITFSCTIPPVGIGAGNSSAVFNNYPSLVIGLGEHIDFDHAATDTDGDSLSYEFIEAKNYVDAKSDPKPISSPPPFPPVRYISPLSATYPMYCSDTLTIDPITGRLTGTPDIIGRYVIAIACHEWRSGVKVNTIISEFEFAVQSVVTTTYQPNAGHDTTIMAGDRIKFHATGARTYTWSPSTRLSNPLIGDPIGDYSIPGYYRYVITGISDSGCIGKDTLNVWVLAYSECLVPDAFTPNGDGKNDIVRPIPVLNSVVNTFRIFNTKGVPVYQGGKDGWDGNYEGVPQEMGAYYWQLEYTDNKGKSRHHEGAVVLVR